MVKVPNQTQNELINREVILNQYMYLNYKDAKDGETLEQICSNVENSKNDLINTKEFKIIKNALENDSSLGRLVIGNQAIPSSKGSKDTGACTFYDPVKNEMNFIFRGTQDGEWFDNGKGMYSSELTPRQEDAIQYFDTVMEKDCIGIDDMIINISGHSKGGNKATTVAMGSKYAKEIDNVVSFDGQGYSPEMIEKFKGQWGQDFDNQIDKIISVNGADDPINVLGVPLSNKNKFYIKTPGTNMESKEGMVGYHSLNYFFIDENQDIKKTMNGYCEQGSLGKYISKVSEKMMKLSSEERKEISLAIMKKIEQGEAYYRDTGMYGESSDNMDLLGAFVHGGPLIIMTLLRTKEGIMFLCDNMDVILETIADDPLHTMLIGGVIYLFLPIILRIGESLYLTMLLIDRVNHLIEKLEAIGAEIKEFFRYLYENALNYIEEAKQWYNETLNVGYKYTISHPYLFINTEKMYLYAEKLRQINGRLDELDQRINKLYTEVGFLDLWNLIHSDLMISYSLRLNKCEKYLKDTANDFSHVEAKLLKG